MNEKSDQKGQELESVRAKTCTCLSPSERFVSVAHFQDLLHLEERLGTVNRGASQGTIERCTYPHKYKKVRPCQRVCMFNSAHIVKWIL